MPFAFSLFIKENYSDAYLYIPILAIGIYYAKPLVKQVYDMTMEFGVKIGTQI